MQKSNVDFYPVLLLSILADTLLRLHTGYWARAGLLALPASAAVLAAVLLLVSASWQENTLLQKVLCGLLTISSALEILRLHALFGSVYPGTLGLAGTCFVVLAPVIYLRREPPCARRPTPCWCSVPRVWQSWYSRSRRACVYPTCMRHR